MRFLFDSLRTVAFVLFLYTLLGICVQAEGGSDDEFARHLRKVMRNYTMWLKENKLDPSPPIKNVLKWGAYDTVVKFDCQLSNHYVVGQSELSVATVTTSNFTEHVFSVERRITGLYESHGDFNCTGVIVYYHFPELRQNLPFSGQGKFLITTNYSTDFFTMRNVGITQDYKLDFSKIWTYYELDANQKYIRLKGEWNDTRVAEKYFADVQAGFGRLYEFYPYFYDDTPSFPSAQLLERYLRERMQGFDLREVLGANDLPSPYIPITTTTSTTEGSSPGTGEKIFVQKAGIICLQAVLLFWFY